MDRQQNNQIITATNRLDTSINDQFEMPEGVGDEREKIGAKWNPFKISD